MGAPVLACLGVGLPGERAFERMSLLVDFELSPLGVAFPPKDPLSVLSSEQVVTVRTPLSRRKKKTLLFINKQMHLHKGGRRGNSRVWAGLCPQQIHI